MHKHARLSLNGCYLLVSLRTAASPATFCRPAALATFDLHVFQSLEDSLCRQTFESDENIIYAKNDQFEWLNKITFVRSVKVLEHR